MSDIPELPFKPLSGKAKLMIIFAAIAIAAIIGVLASYFLGPDNEIEKVMETVVDEAIEHELHLPDGSINIDLDVPKKK